ncbi:MAG: RDD family protein [Janthinobacterium lividum]
MVAQFISTLATMTPRAAQRPGASCNISANNPTNFSLTDEMNSVPELELEYVGFWLRVWASIIDTLVLMVIAVPLLFAVFGRERLMAGVEIDGLPADVITYVLPALLVIAFWRYCQATPGKMVIGARIVDAATGQPTTLRQDVVRYLAYFLSAILLCLGFLWVAFDGRKQGWHDKLAGTVVVRARKRAGLPVRFS